MDRFNPCTYRFLYFYIWVELTVLLGFIVLVSGCALNDKGFVKVRRWENDAAYLVCWEAWGGHLVTNAVDAGLTIGRSKRLYIFPKPQGLYRDPASGQIVIPLEAGHGLIPVEEPQSSPELQARDEPVALVANTTGLTVSLNRLGFGIAFGVQTRGIIRLPHDFDGTLRLRYNSENVDNTQIHLIGDFR